MPKVMVKKAGTDKKLSASFKTSEFLCKCRRADCQALPMDPVFIAKLQALRDLWKRPLIINSGSRCETWNSLVGGTHLSLHLTGQAADVHLDDVEDGTKLAALALVVNMGGIGIAKTFIHVDDGPHGRRWRY